MSIGMICCIVSLAFVGIIMWLLYKNRSKCRNHPIVIGMSAISLTIAVTTAIYLCCQGGCCGISDINYGDTSVTVLTTIIGLLVGWSIYSVIDTQSLIKKHEILKRKTTNEISKLQELVEDKMTDNKRLRDYVNIVQSFTMANVRLSNGEHGDALALYCDSVIGLNRMMNEYGLNRNAEEFELMNKSINMANSIVQNRFIIANSAILRDRHQEIIDGLRGITSRNPRPIMDAIASVYTKR